jgi:hypothetical protein
MFRLVRALFRFLILALGVYLASLLIAFLVRKRTRPPWRDPLRAPRRPRAGMDRPARSDDVVDASYSVVEDEPRQEPETASSAGKVES